MNQVNRPTTWTVDVKWHDDPEPHITAEQRQHILHWIVSNHLKRALWQDINFTSHNQIPFH